MAEVKTEDKDKLLFIMAWSAVVATAFGFILRAFSITDWAVAFGLDATQQGNLNSVGLWPFAISIALISLIIDRVGFRLVFLFALACHVVSTILLLTAKGYDQLYWGTFVLSLGNGAVECAANPLVATAFKNERVRWLNYLHSGWAGGLVLGGLLSIVLSAVGVTDWHVRIGLILIPMAIYGLLMIGRKFPVTERVAANVPYRDMLKVAGGGGAFLVAYLASIGLGGAFYPNAPFYWHLIVALVCGGIFFAYTRSLGNWLFIAILLIMMPQAVTELGTNSWVTDLMGPVLAGNAYWVLVISSAVLFIMRLASAPIIHKISPIGMLLASAAISTIALYLLSHSTSAPLVLFAALLFGLGTAFFWPTTLGMVAEQFPRSGAVGINFIGAAGMLAAGTIGGQLLGAVLDKSNQDYLKANNPAVASSVLGDAKSSFGMTYQPIDAAKVTPETKEVVTAAQNEGKKAALRNMAILPAIVFIAYLLLFLVFRARGGYKAQTLEVTEEDFSKSTAQG